MNPQLLKNLPKERKQERREKHKKGGRDTASQRESKYNRQEKGKKGEENEQWVRENKKLRIYEMRKCS